jgi:hypothetical protein
MENTHSGRENKSRYQILIEGMLSAEWADWLNGQQVGSICPDPSANLTRIIVEIPDQAALRGLVNKIWDLNLVIISVCRWSDSAPAENPRRWQFD